MRVTSILSEVLRGTSTGTSRGLLFMLAFVTLVVPLILLDLAAVRGIERSAEQFSNAGAAVLTVEAPGRVDGAACEALAELDSVRAAGALRQRTNGLQLGALPAGPVPFYDVTPGFPAVLHAERQGGPGVVLSDLVSETLNRTVGGVLALPDRSVPVAGVYPYPDDGRRSGLGYAALAPTSPTAEPFAECWVDVWPMSEEVASLLLLALLPPDALDDVPRVAQLNSTLGAAFDAGAMFEARNTKHAYLVAGAAGLALGYTAILIRRLQHAAALHAGLRRSDLGAILTGEILVWITPAAGLAAATTGLTASSAATAADQLALLLLGMRVLVWAVVGVGAGAAAGLLQVRERALFRYFRDR